MTITSEDIFTARNGVRETGRQCANPKCTVRFEPKSRLNTFCCASCNTEADTARRVDAMRLLRFMEINAPTSLAKIRAAMRRDI